MDKGIQRWRVWKRSLSRLAVALYAVALYYDRWLLLIADLFWRNPQFGIELKASDDSDSDGKCSMVVSLMQKATTLQFDDVYMYSNYFSIYKCWILTSLM